MFSASVTTVIICFDRCIMALAPHSQRSCSRWLVVDTDAGAIWGVSIGGAVPWICGLYKIYIFSIVVDSCRSPNSQLMEVITISKNHVIAINKANCTPSSVRQVAHGVNDELWKAGLSQKEGICGVEIVRQPQVRKCQWDCPKTRFFPPSSRPFLGGCRHPVSGDWCWNLSP